MKYVCLGYIQEGNWDSLPAAEGQRMLEDCFAYDDELRKGGHFLGGEALDSSSGAVTLRMKNGQVDVTDGPYAETKEVLGGLLLLEARDLNHAIALMSNHPGLKMGPFEIRPADEQINRMIAERNSKFAEQPNALAITITRLVDAPSADVFNAITSHKPLTQWWGPRSGRVDWTTPSVEVDPVTGGIFRTCIRSPDGDEYWATGNFLRLDEPNRIEVTHGWENEEGEAETHKQIVVQLDEAEEKTRLCVEISGYESQQSLDSEIGGWNECFDRLVQYFYKLSASTQKNQGFQPAKNTICLWYDSDAEEAARFYAETFPDSSVGAVHRAPADFPTGKKGDVLTVEFTVLGIPCLGLNGGPGIEHNMAFSFQIATADQVETDRYWDAIVSGGGEESQCGWCKDKWGLNWQITPTVLTHAITGPDTAAAKRAFDAMMQMKKIDIAAIETAVRG